MKKSKNLILATGLTISLISLIFNFYFLTSAESRKSQSQKEIEYLRHRNSVIYSDITNAEFQKFFADYYSNEMANINFNKNSKNDSLIFQNIHKKRDEAWMKSINYAYNSTVPDPTKNWNPSQMAEIDSLFNCYNKKITANPYNGLDINYIQKLNNRFLSYSVINDSLIRANNKSITQEIGDFELESTRLGIFRSFGMILQVIGLILVFLKDLNKAKNT